MTENVRTVVRCNYIGLTRVKIGPYSLARVKITPKVLIISFLFANYYDQIICVDYDDKKDNN